jgi:hypothetical protein
VAPLFHRPRESRCTARIPCWSAKSSDWQAPNPVSRHVHLRPGTLDEPRNDRLRAVPLHHLVQPFGWRFLRPAGIVVMTQ